MSACVNSLQEQDILFAILEFLLQHLHAMHPESRVSGISSESNITKVAKVHIEEELFMCFNTCKYI